MDYFPLDTEYNLIYTLPGIYQPLHSWTTRCLDTIAKLRHCPYRPERRHSVLWNHRKRRCLSFRDQQPGRQMTKLANRNQKCQGESLLVVSSTCSPHQGSTCSNIPIKSALHVIQVRYINFTDLNCCLMFLGKSGVFSCAKKQFQLRTVPKPRWMPSARQDHFPSLG